MRLWPQLGWIDEREGRGANSEIPDYLRGIVIIQIGQGYRSILVDPENEAVCVATATGHAGYAGRPGRGDWLFSTAAPGSPPEGWDPGRLARPVNESHG